MRPLPPPLTVSDEAAAFFKKQLGEQPCILLTVNKKGCAGGEYQFEPFALERLTDRHDTAVHNGVTLVFERVQLLKLIGAEVVLNQTRFETRVDLRNPHEISRCGCGESVQLEPAPAGRTAPAEGDTGCC